MSDSAAPETLTAAERCKHGHRIEGDELARACAAGGPEATLCAQRPRPDVCPFCSSQNGEVQQLRADKASLLRELATIFGPAPTRKGATEDDDRCEAALDLLIAVSAQYLDTGRGDLDGAIAAARAVLERSS